MIKLILQEEVLLKYLYNPATDNFESLEPTLKDRFNLKDQMADAASATEMAIDESLKAFKTYQDAGGTMSYKDFIASGNEGVSKFFKDGGSVETPKRGLVDGPGSYAGLEKFEILKINNPSNEALNEIRQIIDNLDIKQNNILGKEVRNLPKEITVEKLATKIQTPGYKRPTIAKELLKRILNEKNIKTYDNYRTEKIVTVLNDALTKNKGNTLYIKPSAAVELLPEFEVKNVKGGGGNSILKTYRNYIAGGERIGTRAGIPVPKEIGGRKVTDIITDLDKNFLDVTGGRSVGKMKILEEIKLLDTLANENPNVSATKLKELFEEAGGTNFTERLKKIHPVKMGNLTEGDTGVILKQAAEEGAISNSMPDSLRKAIKRYSVDLNVNRFFKQAEKYRKSNPELAYKYTKAMNLISDANMKKLGMFGAGEHALPLSAIETAGAAEDTYFKIDAYVDHELNDWKSKNFDRPIFRKKGLAFKYNNANKLGLSKKQKLDIQEEIMQRLDFMKKRAPELMENVTFDFSGGKFTANSSTPSILDLDEKGFKALNEKGNRINQKFITEMPDAVKLTSTGTIASIDDKFIRPKKKIQGANLAKKSLKSFAKAFPVIGTAIGIYDVNKALKAGITDPRDLYAAYEVSPEIAAKQKTMREDPTGKLLQEEIANLPEITTDDQVANALMDSFPNQSFLQYQSAVDDGFQGSFEEYLQQQSMKMARGGRVGFQDGTPDPIFDQIVAALDNTDLIENLEQENKRTLEEQVLGEEGDRTLMQTLNTMIDPRAYPYYAQELASGVANIPELAFRFPAALAYLFGKTSLATTTGDLSQIGMKDVQKAMEIMDPKLTKAVKEKIGFKDMLEESREKATGPQRTTGGLLEFGAEAVGPATPFFLLKAFPKIGKQIRNLVGTAASAEKVNKEIETKMATQGVDQTRRDILLAAGAGGAVAILKYLGLDKLIKTTKVAKAAPEIITKGGTPKYFFDFVNLIKTKGDDVTDKASTIERQKVYDYDGYTLYEDIGSGKIAIRKDTSGGANYYVGDGEYETIDGILYKEEIVYDPPETIVGKDGKAKEVPDIYEETTLKPDYDGSDGDVEGGLESINEILELLAKDGNKYSLKELKEMGMNPEGLGRDFLKKILKNPDEIKLLDPEKAFKDTINKVKYKIEKAEGGIIAGVSSGPPPKSGPTPHGLPYVAKNVRPITERK